MGITGRIRPRLSGGVHLRPDALVPPHPANALVLPTPLWELGGALVIALILCSWGRGCIRWDF